MYRSHGKVSLQVLSSGGKTCANISDVRINRKQSLDVLFSEQSVRPHVPNRGELDRHLCCLRFSPFGSLLNQVAIAREHAWENSQFNLAILTQLNIQFLGTLMFKTF